ncbi:MAG: formylglycine-generating enzyme family protein [Bacteroidia bacterium]|nr:formylglycine-generating enzyme family protein [Bacteroidia bacterium]
MKVFKYLFLAMILLTIALLFSSVQQELRSASYSSPELVLIKGGKFMMGQEDGEGDERPVHEVELSDFYIGKYEITVGEYRQYCQSNSVYMPAKPEWGWKDDHPIFNVSWNEADAYIVWINKTQDENYRLPTEAEFEYVMRKGGQPGLYPWGAGTPTENIADESKLATNWSRGIWKGYNDGFPYTSPVGRLPANALGVHDLNGNVWEWVSDWYGAYPTEAVKDPQGPETGSHKVGRGASYNADPWHCRTAGRNWMGPNEKIPAGFRLAKNVR